MGARSSSVALRIAMSANPPPDAVDLCLDLPPIACVVGDTVLPVEVGGSMKRCDVP